MLYCKESQINGVAATEKCEIQGGLYFILGWGTCKNRCQLQVDV